MKGGSLSGKGKYGCVFQPQLKCKNKSKSKDLTKVGKITSLLDGKNEIQIGNYLKSIPNSSTYTIYAEGESCIPDKESNQSERDLNKCEIIDTIHLEDTMQLIMPWGGKPLSSVNLKPSSFPFFKVFEECLAIGAFCVLHDICHFDISIVNILVSQDYTPKLIDFGFSFLGSKLKKENIRNIWRHFDYEHDTETPEITLVLTSNKHIPADIAINELQLHKPAVQRLAILCGVSPSKWGQDLKQWSNSSNHFKNKEWYEIFKLYWPGFDSWSLGAVLLIILEIEMSFQSFIVSKEWIEKGDIVKEVLRGMCHANPLFRLDAAEALHLFTKGTHPLIRAGGDGSSKSDGSDWIEKKQKNRLALL